MLHCNNALAAALTLSLTACAGGTVDPRTTQNDRDGGFITLPDAADAAVCRGNRDGVIQREELPFVDGIEVRYRTNPTGTLAPVNTRGTPRPDGTRAWDYSSEAGDLVTLSARSTAGMWFAMDFPTAQYASRLDPRATPLGVYRNGDMGVEFLGVAGAAEADGTRVRYASPILLLRFPLSVGQSWSSESATVDGMFEHTPVAARDRYDVAVDARGELRLAALTFPDALRVRVEVTQRFPAGPGTHKIQYLWLVECYGEVARVSSRDGEADPDFTLATEYRRLGL